MGKREPDKPKEVLQDLIKTLRIILDTCEDRLKAYEDLIDFDTIHEDLFERMVENERIGIIVELDSMIDYYRGIQ